jgi:protein-S-isoprenylcysteine O-methyltransferase Ste14
MGRTLSLVVRNVVFTMVVPGLGGAWFPWWLLTRTLGRRFGGSYLDYRRAVPRWIPRPPGRGV